MNPEDHVLDAIDELVNETMAAGVDAYGHPLDDYTADRYPDCNQCSHEWHGQRCAHCSCEASTGEVFKAAPAVIYPRWAMSNNCVHAEIDYTSGVPTCRYCGFTGEVYTDQIERVVLTGPPGDNQVHAYTIADVEAMRGGFASPHRNTPIRMDEPRDRSGLVTPMGMILPNVRFWGVVGDAGELGEITGRFELVDLVIDAAQSYVLGTIAEIVGIPREALDAMIPPWGERRDINWSVDIPAPEPIDVESWFGAAELVLEPHTHEGGCPYFICPHDTHLSGTAMDFHVDYGRQLDEAVAAYARSVDIDEQAELDAARQAGAIDAYPLCPICGRSMPEVDPADIPDGCIPPICVDCLRARELNRDEVTEVYGFPPNLLHDPFAEAVIDEAIPGDCPECPRSGAERRGCLEAPALICDCGHSIAWPTHHPDRAREHLVCRECGDANDNCGMEHHA